MEEICCCCSTLHISSTCSDCSTGIFSPYSDICFQKTGSVFKTIDICNCFHDLLLSCNSIIQGYTWYWRGSHFWNSIFQCSIGSKQGFLDLCWSTWDGLCCCCTDGGNFFLFVEQICNCHRPCNPRYDLMEQRQIGRLDEQNCNNILLHVHLEAVLRGILAHPSGKMRPAGRTDKKNNSTRKNMSALSKPLRPSVWNSEPLEHGCW